MFKTKTKNVSLNIKTFNKILALIIVVLGIYYVAGINDLSIKGFQLTDLKKKKNKLTELNNKLELAAMNLSSYANISSRANSLKMVAVGEISYVEAGAEAVVKK